MVKKVMSLGVPIPSQNPYKDFPAYEGSMNHYYGHIRSGKTTAAVMDMVEALNDGVVVYSNIPLRWNGFDERDSRWNLFLGVLGLKKEFIVHSKKNFYYVDFLDPEFKRIFENSTDCCWWIDEGYLFFNSYRSRKDISLAEMLSIFGTGHVNRTINIVSQRVGNIDAMIRGNVNRFYRCEVRFKLFNLIRFWRSEYQDVTSDERPNEDLEPVSVKKYWGRKKIFEMFDSKYMRQGKAISQPLFSSFFYLTWRERLRGLFGRSPKDIPLTLGSGMVDLYQEKENG